MPRHRQPTPPPEEARTERLEQVVYTRFLDPNARKGFFSAYKEIEALWEILSPSAELHDHIDTFKRLAHLYTVVRNAYADRPELRGRTGAQDPAAGGRVGCDVRLGQPDQVRDLRSYAHLRCCRQESGPNEAKVFNLVRGLQTEVQSEPGLEAVLRPLKERAEHVLKGLEERTTSGLAAMDMLEALAKEKEASVAAARDSCATLQGRSACTGR